MMASYGCFSGIVCRYFHQADEAARRGQLYVRPGNTLKHCRNGGAAIGAVSPQTRAL
jgi:hypothetical protein